MEATKIVSEKTLIKNAIKYLCDGTGKTIDELKNQIMESYNGNYDFVKFGNVTLMYINNKNFQNNWILNKKDSRGFYVTIETAKTFNKYYKIK